MVEGDYTVLLSVATSAIQIGISNRSIHSSRCKLSLRQYYGVLWI